MQNYTPLVWSRGRHCFNRRCIRSLQSYRTVLGPEANKRNQGFETKAPRL